MSLGWIVWCAELLAMGCGVCALPTVLVERLTDAGLFRIGYGPLIREYVYFLESKLNFHRQHIEFNGTTSMLSVLASRIRVNYIVQVCSNMRSISA